MIPPAKRVGLLGGQRYGSERVLASIFGLGLAHIWVNGLFCEATMYELFKANAGCVVGA
jgi:hypothetical protein